MMINSLEQIEEYVCSLFDQRCYVTTIRMKRSLFKELTCHLTAIGFSAHFKLIGTDSYEWPTACGNVNIRTIPDKA